MGKGLEGRRDTAFKEDAVIRFPIGVMPLDLHGFPFKVLKDGDVYGLIAPFTFSEEYFMRGFFKGDDIDLGRACPPTTVSIRDEGKLFEFCKIRDGSPANIFIDKAEECGEVLTNLLENEVQFLNLKKTLVGKDIAEPEAEKLILYGVETQFALLWSGFCDGNLTFDQAKVDEYFQVFGEGVGFEAQPGGDISDLPLPFGDDFKDREVMYWFGDLLKEYKLGFGIEKAMFGQDILFNVGPRVSGE